MKKDDYHFFRTSMVKDQIQKRGIKDGRILRVFEEVPRHLFVLSGEKHLAYHDHPLPIGEDQTISQPYIVAQMIEALELDVDDEVLEIGTGSGYQTAILASLCKKVYTIERIPKLQEKAIDVLAELGYDNVEYLLEDGKKGWKEKAPFTKIIVSAASQSIPEDLISQLDVGGKIVIPVGGEFLQKLLLLEKRQQSYQEKVLGYCRFVKLI